MSPGRARRHDGRILPTAFVAVISGEAGTWDLMCTGKVVEYPETPSHPPNARDRRFRELSDDRKPDENGDRSARVLTEFDCKKQRVRSLKWAYFRGSMGGREMTAWRTKPGNWMPVAPGTLGRTIGRLVCDVQR